MGRRKLVAVHSRLANVWWRYNTERRGREPGKQAYRDWWRRHDAHDNR